MWQLRTTNEKLNALTERQTGSLPSLVVASDHRVDSNGVEGALCKIGFDNRGKGPKHNLFMANC